MGGKKAKTLRLDPEIYAQGKAVSGMIGETVSDFVDKSIFERMENLVEKGLINAVPRVSGPFKEDS